MKLERLTAGMTIPWGGDNLAVVDDQLAGAFAPGDRLIVVQENGALLRVPAASAALASAAIDAARAALPELAAASDKQLAAFFSLFAERLQTEHVWRAIAAANAADVARAGAAGRSSGRLAVSEAMRGQMIAGLLAWRDLSPARGRLVRRVDHDRWSVDLLAAPLGVVGFVFEGRPNVLTDAVGVIAGGNAAVLRIGADALETARTISQKALAPALRAADLPEGAAVLIDSPDRAAGWALFSDPRLALAIARGSGPAVAQLGAVARQSGIPASLHGTGGAWIIAETSADAGRFAAVVEASLDRKVCNTLNTACITRDRADELVPVFIDALWRAGEASGCGARLHVGERETGHIPERWRGVPVQVRRAEGEREEAFVQVHFHPDLGHEWEWDGTPEVWLAVVDNLDEAIDRFNAVSPTFIASLIAEDTAAQDQFYRRIEAPFVGDGFTRWVDGQYALGLPELGLANWQSGRPLARGGVLSGEGVFTIRARMRQKAATLRR
jgi:glutamate-5-semialdehyde dehydrogenase